MSDVIRRISQISNQTANDAAKDLEDLANKQEETLDKKKELRNVQSNLESYKSNTSSNMDQIQQGIASTKDSFETKASNPLFEANSETGQLKFGDGVQGKIPSTSSDISSRYSSGIGQSGNNVGAIDRNPLVQEVLRESYLQTTEDLKFYADKVKHFNETKKQLREAIKDLVDQESLEKLDGLSAGKVKTRSNCSLLF
jgi:Lhr-like helicase